MRARNRLRLLIDKTIGPRNTRNARNIRKLVIACLSVRAFRVVRGLTDFIIHLSSFIFHLSSSSSFSNAPGARPYMMVKPGPERASKTPMTRRRLLSHVAGPAPTPPGNPHAGPATFFQNRPSRATFMARIALFSKIRLSERQSKRRGAKSFQKINPHFVDIATKIVLHSRPSHLDRPLGRQYARMR